MDAPDAPGGALDDVRHEASIDRLRRNADDPQGHTRYPLMVTATRLR